MRPIPNYSASRRTVVSLVALSLAALLLRLPASPQQVTATAPTTTPALTYSQLATTTSAPAGFTAITAGNQTVVVSTSAVTANSQILVQYDETAGSSCTSALLQEGNRYFVNARSPGSSFTIKSTAAIATGNTACLSYFIVN